MNNTQITSETLSEKPKLIRFGFLFLPMRPLTLSQIWEISSLLEGVEQKDLQGEMNVIAEMLGQKSNIRKASQIATVMLFRSHLCRFLFGRFIRKRLTMQRYQKMMEYYLMTLRAAFFLISITSLKGVRKMAEPTNTAEVTALGDLSEE